MTNEFAANLDTAQVVLYVFWLFFFALIWWLRMEDRREGYPLESDNPRRVMTTKSMLLPAPKTFLLPHGGSVQAPNFERDTREIQGERTARAAGAALEPTGDAMTAGLGPAAYAMRSDEVELTREGHDLIVPMRVETQFAVSAGPDPRGWDVVATDGKVAGTVKDVWVDRAELMVRYLEVSLAGSDTESRLLPIGMLRLKGNKKVEVASVKAEHFASVPTLKEPDRITVLEEERVSAFYAGGRLYADPSRLRPIL